MIFLTIRNAWWLSQYLAVFQTTTASVFRSLRSGKSTAVKPW